MLSCITCSGLCSSVLLRKFCGPCIMGVGFLSAVFFLILVTSPSFSSGGVHSWLCGSCATCPLCPACEPHLSISPTCECSENLNNCNCNCPTHNELHRYHQQWNSQISNNQNVTFVALMNSHRFKHHLLLWLIGFSFFNILLFLLTILLIIFAPALVRRYANWHSHSTLRRRQRLMVKHNLVPLPPSTVLSSPPSPPSTTSSPIAPALSSYADLQQQLESQKKLVFNLSRDLHASRSIRSSLSLSHNPPLTLPSSSAPL